MGIIRAVTGSVGSVLEEQWREFFSCDAMDMDTLMRRGVKHVSAGSANTRRDDNVVTNGSVLLVADGQCVIAVSQGKVIDVCAEPGEHIFVDPAHPGGIKGFLNDVGRRVSFGGGDIQPVTHRIYYLNILECMNNVYYTPEPVPVRLADANIGLDMDAAVLLGGMYSYRVADPEKLYRLLIGNIGSVWRREQLTGQMTAELLSALGPALSQLAAQGIRPYQVPEHVPQLRDALRDEMSRGWCGAHGLEIVSLSLSSFRLLDAAALHSVQYAGMLRDESMAAATLVEATAEAMQSAASNSSGRPFPAVFTAGTDAGWTCSCGQKNTGKFCSECGKPKPSE